MPKFFHLRVPPTERAGAITVAYETEEANPRVRVGMSFCSFREIFNKKLGRSIATSRLRSNPMYLHIPASVEITEDVLRKIVAQTLLRASSRTLWTETLPVNDERFNASQATEVTVDDYTVWAYCDGNFTRSRDEFGVSADGEAQPLTSSELDRMLAARGWLFRVPSWVSDFLREYFVPDSDETSVEFEAEALRQQVEVPAV